VFVRSFDSFIIDSFGIHDIPVYVSLALAASFVYKKKTKISKKVTAKKQTKTL